MPSTIPHPVLRKPANDPKNTYGDVLRFITKGMWIDDQHWLHGGDGDDSATVISQPLPEAFKQSQIHPISVICHSNAGPRKTPWSSLLRFWARTDISGEAHIQLDGVDAVKGRDAIVVQAMPFNRRADCNAKANGWWKNGKYVGALSIETQDRGSPTLPTTPWSIPQFEAMVNMITCWCVVYGISCAEPITWNDSGIGYHSRFKEWSIYVGKTCPGATRIAQMPELRRRVAENLIAFSQVTDWKCGQGGVR